MQHERIAFTAPTTKVGGEGRANRVGFFGFPDYYRRNERGGKPRQLSSSIDIVTATIIAYYRVRRRVVRACFSHPTATNYTLQSNYYFYFPRTCITFFYMVTRTGNSDTKLVRRANDRNRQDIDLWPLRAGGFIDR